tara:strand:- start:213 stop:455 length:243 start_codon:yes stop_codon:yes gene_type:complete
MLNGWSIPAVWIFVVAQASAAVWWASGTDQQVGNNTTAIVQVVQNEKEIAVIEVQQRAIADDVTEIKEMMVEIRTLILKQ